MREEDFAKAYVGQRGRQFHTAVPHCDARPQARSRGVHT